MNLVKNKTYQNSIYISLVLILLFALLYGAKFRTNDKHIECVDIPAKLFSHFDYNSPGLGLDNYQNKIQDHAMAYALYTSAAVNFGELNRAKIAADWLVKNNASRNKTGWGLPFEWDAFADGSTNPIDTVYGITSALAIRALLDIYESTGTEAYLTTAISALEYYSHFFTPTEKGGYFWYSDQTQDNHAVINVTAMLMGQYARAGRIGNHKSFILISDKSFKFLLENAINKENEIYWNYSTNSSRLNDSVHAAYTVIGIVDYLRYREVNYDIKPALKHLDSFISYNRIYEFPAITRQSNSKVANRAARSWGVGAIIYAYSNANQLNKAKMTRNLLKQYFSNQCIAGTTPSEIEFIPRMQAHVVWGVAEYHKITNYK
jgi:hypothetical protein